MKQAQEKYISLQRSIIPAALLTSHGFAYSLNEASRQSDPLNDGHWKQQKESEYFIQFKDAIARTGYVHVRYRFHIIFLANNSMIYKHKTEKDAHSVAAKVILVKLGTRACWWQGGIIVGSKAEALETPNTNFMYTQKS